jgi:hypothetical protein
LEYRNPDPEFGSLFEELIAQLPGEKQPSEFAFIEKTMNSMKGDIFTMRLKFCFSNFLKTDMEKLEGLATVGNVVQYLRRKEINSKFALASNRIYEFL